MLGIILNPIKSTSSRCHRFTIMFSSSGIPTNELAFMLVNYDEVSTRIHITVLRKEGSEAGAYLGPNQLPAEDVPKTSHFWPQQNEGTEPCSYLFSCVIERCPSLWSPFIYRENAIENTNLIICSCENALLTIERSCLDVATMEVHPLVVAGGVDSTAEGRRKANICWSLRDPHMVWGY